MSVMLLMRVSCVCVCCGLVFCFFFFKQKTAYEMRISDWSSDVCSSDLALLVELDGAAGRRRRAGAHARELQRLRVGDGDVGAEVDHHRMIGRRRIQEIGRASCRERVCQYV